MRNIIKITLFVLLLVKTVFVFGAESCSVTVNWYNNWDKSCPTPKEAYDKHSLCSSKYNSWVWKPDYIKCKEGKIYWSCTSNLWTMNNWKCWFKPKEEWTYYYENGDTINLETMKVDTSYSCDVITWFTKNITGSCPTLQETSKLGVCTNLVWNQKITWTLLHRECKDNVIHWECSFKNAPKQNNVCWITIAWFDNYRNKFISDLDIISLDYMTVVWKKWSKEKRQNCRWTIYFYWLFPWSKRSIKEYVPDHPYPWACLIDPNKFASAFSFEGLYSNHHNHLINNYIRDTVQVTCSSRWREWINSFNIYWNFQRPWQLEGNICYMYLPYISITYSSWMTERNGNYMKYYLWQKKIPDWTKLHRRSILSWKPESDEQAKDYSELQKLKDQVDMLKIDNTINSPFVKKHNIKTIEALEKMVKILDIMENDVFKLKDK